MDTKRFRDVNPRVNFAQQEEEILSFWDREKIFQKSLDLRAGAERYVFYEGPPTANGKPGIHHALARYLKDLFPRFKTMQGYLAERKGGWDTHGLPVEIGVEKALGFSGKADIENYGVAEFNAKAKESVWEYKDLWERFTQRMGYWVDLDSPYVTYDPKYIESIWWILKQIWEKDLVYLGHRVSPWCPRCGTVLSSHELAQGYQEDTDTSVYVKFKVKNEENTFILAWTTTPWTLPGNVALAVGSDIDYVAVELDGERLILAGALVEKVIGSEAKVVGEYKGADLEGWEYEPLFPNAIAKDVPGYENAFKVVLADFVTTEDGTGVVHTAVMYGEDDYNLGTKLGLPKVHTVDKEGKFFPSVAKWAGQFVKSKEVEQGIISDLTERGLLLKTLEYKHEYPHCWRCETPLIYYATDSWFIAMSKLRSQLVENNQTVNWIPDHIKDGRFGEWLKDAKDWAISRARYWGTPLPFWKSEDGDVICVGSYAELKSLAKDPDKILNQSQDDGTMLFDPHRPVVDDIVLVKDGKEYRRVPEILDVWFDSGAMPYAQWHYPFENTERIDGVSGDLESGGKPLSFPADFIAEGLDQTRGWFYTLLAISTLLGKEAPYRNVICTGLILDKYGKKMSKSKGNTVDPWEMFDKYGSDILKWYLLTINHPGLPKNFDEQGLVAVTRRFVLTLWNTYSFFVMYANLDGFVPEKMSDSKSDNILDRWILARCDELTATVTKSLEGYEPMPACLAVEAFVSDLSNWYVRRSRRRFWNKGEGQDAVDKQWAYETLYRVLMTVTKLMAPLMPFLSEAMYKNLKSEKDALSVHLVDWPRADLADASVLKEMSDLREAVEMGLNLREQAGIKVRQPLSSVSVKIADMHEDLVEILKDELNVKNVVLANATDELDTVITDDLRVEGVARELVRSIQIMRKDQGFEVQDRIRIEWESEDADVQKAFEVFAEYIREETLATDVVNGAVDQASELQVNGNVVKLMVTKNQ